VAPEAQREWEARAGRPAAAAAIASLVFFLVSGFYLSAALDERPDETRDLLVAADRESGDFVVFGVLQGIALIALIGVLYYLYRATRNRRSQIPQAALVLGILGPVTAAVVAVLRQVELTHLASDFVAAGPRTEDRADDLLSGGTFGLYGGVGLGANIAVGFSMILIALNSMRAGLLSRFMGILGIIVGVFYVIPLGVQLIQIFWLGALAALFLDRWPGGRGPAWESGEAIRWPSAQERAAAMQEERGEQPELEPAAADPDTPQDDDEATRRRRRKKKRRR
jgi:hypothetical protein